MTRDLDHVLPGERAGRAQDGHEGFIDDISPPADPAEVKGIRSGVGQRCRRLARGSETAIRIF